MNLQRVMQVVVCSAMGALIVTGTGLISTRPVGGHEAKPFMLRSAAALDQLKQLGQSESLRAARPPARFSIGRTEDTLLGRQVRHALGSKEQAVVVAENNGAPYPPMVNLDYTQQQKLVTADGAANDYFGNVVALNGDTLAVGANSSDIGANQDQGSVYVFTHSIAGWVQQQKLTADDGAAGDLFGGRIALSADTLVVGAPKSDISGNQDQGSVYVFIRSGTGWVQQQKLTAGDGAANDHFGIAVALNGDSLMVGAIDGDIGPNADQGSVYVFTRSNGVWTQQQKIAANDGAAGDHFGGAVAVNSDILVVGASSDDIGVNNNQGAAYVFTRSSAGWTQEQKLTANDGAASDGFGSRIALSGNTLAVGAFVSDIGGNQDQGSVYVFTRNIAGWVQQQKLTADDGAALDFFGNALALSGDTLVIGAYIDDVGASLNQGSAYVFTRNNGIWTQQQRLTANDGAVNENFGVAVALDGGTVVVGAHSDDIGANVNQGSVYVFARPTCPMLTINPPTLPNGRMGTPYSKLLTATGGQGPYNFVVKGQLPPGLSLSANGVLSGTPTQAGSFTFAVAANDANGCDGAQLYSIAIKHLVVGIGAAPPANGDGR